MPAINENGIPVAQNYAAIRGVITLPQPKFSAVLALGNDALSDAGLGIFYWDQQSTAVDDDSTVLQPADRPAVSGRWAKLGASEASFNELALWGDGSDGDFEPSSGTTVLTRDMFYNRLAPSGTAIIDCSGFRIFCKELDLSAAQVGAITRNPNNGSAGNANGTAGAAAAATHFAGDTLAGSVASVIGGAGGIGAGVQAGVATAKTNTYGGAGGLGSAGGAGSGGAGGASRAGAAVTMGAPLRRLALDPYGGISADSTINTSFAGGAIGGSGGGGGGDGTAGGGGGSAGTGGGVIDVWAEHLITSASTPASVITCLGGNGGIGGSPAAGNRGGGGAGGGGGGGAARIVYGSKTGPSIANAVNCSGGNGGNGGNGIGTGVGADGATGGNGGRVVVANLATQTITDSFGSAGSAGTAASGVTGGTGGAGGACLVAL